MKTAILKFFKLFWLDEAFFERVMRSLLFGWAGAAAMFAKELGELVVAPRLILWIKVSGVVSILLAGLIMAGEKNEKREGQQEVAPPSVAHGFASFAALISLVGVCLLAQVAVVTRWHPGPAAVLVVWAIGATGIFFAVLWFVRRMDRE